MLAIKQLCDNEYAKDNFFPTPEEVVDLMIRSVTDEKRFAGNILEPSAGKGDILDRLNESASFKRYRLDITNVDCVEVDPNLRYVLNGKKYTVVHDDFLSFNTYKRYDLILMNPPFADGEKHLLKALSLLKPGGEVVCLLNSETIDNRFSRTRQEMWQQLSYAGKAKIQNLGSAFKKAERKTDVSVSLVHFVKSSSDNYESEILESLKKSYRSITLNNEGEQSALAKGGFIDALVDKCNFEIELSLKLISEYKVLEKHMKKSFSDTYGGAILNLETSGQGSVDINKTIELVRLKYWRELFNNKEFIKKFPGSVRDKFMRELDNLRRYDFSAYNILTIMQKMNKEIVSSIEENILNLFDEWTIKYHWSKGSEPISGNIHYYNGWATNNAFAVKKKVIFPCYGGYEIWNFGRVKSYKFNYETARKLDDIERAFDLLAGETGKENDITSRASSIVEHSVQDLQITSNIETRYFFVTVHKKGTVHLTFKDDDLLKKFNLFAGKHKKWLPESYGKKHYEDMSEKEKEVVNSFEGKASYEKTVSNQAYFLSFENNHQMLLLEK